MRYSFILFLFTSLSTLGQSNYDNIYTLLSAKDYETAEPLLRQYIKENKRNANAFLYMGIIYQEKVSSSENAMKISSFMDSSVYYYNAALSTLSVSQLKTNEKYYEMYRRRDLKTGNIKISYEDIRLDIERRRNSLTNELLTYCRSNNANDLQRPGTTENEPQSTAIKLSGKYYALIIGVSEYDNYKLNLSRPVSDAKRFSEIIIKDYIFETENVVLLLDPTRQQILTALFGLRKKIEKVDNLLIFYAGHGLFDEQAGQGYWWPRDADSESPSNWLSNSDLRDQIRGIKSSHTLLIADACFSGGIFRTRGVTSIKDASLDIISLYKLPSRRAITSGTMTTVPDQSIFFDYLIKSLKNNNSTYLTSQSLFESFRTNVINNTLQVPQDGIISETGDEGGDFVFIKRL